MCVRVEPDSSQGFDSSWIRVADWSRAIQVEIRLRDSSRAIRVQELSRAVKARIGSCSAGSRGSASPADADPLAAPLERRAQRPHRSADRSRASLLRPRPRTVATATPIARYPRIEGGPCSASAVPGPAVAVASQGHLGRPERACRCSTSLGRVQDKTRRPSARCGAAPTAAHQDGGSAYKMRAVCVG